jgi:phage head maturation protease
MPSYRNTIIGSIDANDASVTLPYRHHENGGVGVQIAGTFAGTLQFEVTVDGTNYVGVFTNNVTTNANAVTTTTAGVYKFSAVGVSSVRVRSTAWTSGTAVVTIAALAGGGV